jgi:hypothetical protein
MQRERRPGWLEAATVAGARSDNNLVGLFKTSSAIFATYMHMGSKRVVEDFFILF